MISHSSEETLTGSSTPEGRVERFLDCNSEVFDVAIARAEEGVRDTMIYPLSKELTKEEEEPGGTTGDDETTPAARRRPFFPVSLR